jgi:hypothetical protein
MLKSSFVSKRNMEEFCVVIMKRFRSNWFKKTKGPHVTYTTRQSVLRRKRIYASFVKSKIPKILSLFNTIPRTQRSHCHKRIQHPNVKKSSKPRTLQDTFNDLLFNIQKPLGIHHIRTILFSLPGDYALSVAIGDNGNRMIFEMWWNFFYDLFSTKNVADVNSIDSFVSKRNMEEFCVLLMIYFLIYRNLLEYTIFAQSYFHYLETTSKILGILDLTKEA